MRDPDEDVAELLRRLDHPVPTVRVDDLIARGGAGRWRRTSMPLAAAATLFITGVALALPGSPLRRAVAHALGIGVRQPAAGAPRVAAAPPPAARSSGGAGATVVPGRQLVVRFVALRRAARLRIEFVDAAEASVISHEGTVAFSIGPDRIIASDGTAADYVLTVPRRLPDLRVQLDDVALFRRVNGRVTTAVAPDSVGTYTLQLPRP